MTVTVSDRVTLTRGEIVPINGDRFVVLESFARFSVVDAEGTTLVTTTDIFDPFEHIGSDVWHVRDDGAGKFSVYTQLGTGSTATRNIVSFNADGTRLSLTTYEDGNPTSGTANPFNTYFRGVDLPDGKVAGIYTDDDFQLVIFNADGTVASTTEIEESTTSDRPTFVARPVAVYNDDKIYVFHYNRDTGLSFFEAAETYLTIFNLDGTVFKEIQKVSEASMGLAARLSTLKNDDPVDAAVLSDGKIVVTYASESFVTGVAQTSGDIFYKIYNADGTVFKAEARANSDLFADLQTHPEVHAFNDGTFAITYANESGLEPNPGTSLIRLFNADGTPNGESVPIESFGFGLNTEILPDGTGLVSDSPTINTVFPIEVELGESIAPSDEPTESDDDLEGTKGKDNVDLLGGNDTYNAKGGKDKINGGDGDDEIDGGGGKDTLNGNDGNDVLRGGGGKDKLNGGDGGDSLNGGGGKDNLKGNDGNDFLVGGGGSDRLNGGDDDDNLSGGGGKDKIEGGAGNDSLTGGGGADTFIFTSRGDRGTDIIEDFELGKDRLQLRDSDRDDIDVVGGFGLGTLITYDGGQITIKSTTITIDDIEFV
ncbi:MAG: calcium-binding protein [Pseudomonadota bacterium]